MKSWLWVSTSRIQLWIWPNGIGIWTWECIFIGDKSSTRWRYPKREDLEIYLLKDIEIQNTYWWSFLVAQLVKKPPVTAGDPSFIPRSGRSPGGRHGNRPQYSCPENPMDRGAWWAIVHGSQRVGQNWNDLVYLHLFQCYGIAYYTVLYRDDTAKIFSDLQLRG